MKLDYAADRPTTTRRQDGDKSRPIMQCKIGVTYISYSCV